MSRERKERKKKEKRKMGIGRTNRENNVRIEKKCIEMNVGREKKG